LKIEKVGFYKTRQGQLAKVQSMSADLATGWLQCRDGKGGQYAMVWDLEGNWALRGGNQKTHSKICDLVEFVGEFDKWPMDRECE